MASSTESDESTSAAGARARSHLHWWFMGRPARTPQLASSFAAIWDDVLPPTPQEIWDVNLAAVVRALG
jgi:hypothetical protein